MERRHADNLLRRLIAFSSDVTTEELCEYCREYVSAKSSTRHNHRCWLVSFADCQCQHNNLSENRSGLYFCKMSIVGSELAQFFICHALNLVSLRLVGELSTGLWLNHSFVHFQSMAFLKVAIRISSICFVLPPFPFRVLIRYPYYEHREVPISRVIPDFFFLAACQVGTGRLETWMIAEL
ncbi:hypothetical protein RCL_jg13363.t1 [Rhizophagus clarus]|uniref:Uncharacterized protein n=1 Tax=Rhizophagus clarus TaxID=94130 RepID=A0A8H3QV12_9GLOM|nr:hypothetical protein RCL_jg13363.t1 [Rhizophagus clarus]